MTETKSPYFGHLTDRMTHYREAVLDKKPYIDAERAILATEAYQKHQNKPANLKRAYMLQTILENMTIYIEDESLIAGNQASSNKDAPIFPEYTLEFVLNELDLFENEMGMCSTLPKKPSNSSEILPHSGKTITYVLAAGSCYQKKCKCTWKQVSLAWKAR